MGLFFVAIFILHKHKIYYWSSIKYIIRVAYDIAKIYIWKQITTDVLILYHFSMLLMILQRYTFGSKSQLRGGAGMSLACCLWYCKDIHLEANHNFNIPFIMSWNVAYDIAKIYIWKQITTPMTVAEQRALLLMILQRYTFGSKSQRLL